MGAHWTWAVWTADAWDIGATEEYDMSEQVSGQITVSTAGTAEQGPSTPEGAEFMLKAHPGNTGNVAVGNDGNDDVTMSNGMVLAPGDVIFATFFGGFANALNALWFDADNDGDVICWLKVGG